MKKKSRREIKTSQYLSSEMKITVQMHNHGGDDFEGGGYTDTKVWLRDSEIQIAANKNQKIGIQREDGLLVIYFWSTGITENSSPDHRIIIPPLGNNLKLEELDG